MTSVQNKEKDTHGRDDRSELGSPRLIRVRVLRAFAAEGNSR
jgi:hypothetical protein